ncbi:Gfo/Idh/MocA family oxidoreductase [Microbacterium sp. 1.5R]|uniref:Gfo/Idh/MocA family oxidoreductase n=1 Tax=Microbacterium sp. 1.5R TaxID=1916917 RepID=UPI00119D8D8F|nr:Gfo/Idh/MocA family oxidoreductase [Microbacterium sp. 1.5R]
MTTRPQRVAFAGLAHSHPDADARNIRALGGEVVGVFDGDQAAAAAFARRHGTASLGSPADLLALRPDLVIATPRTHEAAALVRALRDGVTPVFVNKVVAATPAQLDDWSDAADPALVGTSSVLRFAPALAALRTEVEQDDVLAVRVRAQHDAAGFRTVERSWQDAPDLGGGILATVGVHAWEMVDVVLPGGRLSTGTGWTRRAAGSPHSEDAAGLDARVVVAGRAVPVQVSVSGVPGPDAYAIDVVTTGGLRSCVLDVDDPNTALGFEGLIRALLDASADGCVVAPWRSAQVVVENTVRAAQIARAGGGDQW